MVKKMVDPILHIEDLWLRRNGHEILHGVKLDIFPGQVHALLGLNGSGKSSLAYTIMGCEGYVPDSGAILFEGRDLVGKSVTERARLGITLAWQEPARFEGIPVGKYVSLGQPQADREQTVAALEAVALPPKVYGYRAADQTLSGGERKRVELAAVFAMHPRLAILDEPDSGIDILSLVEIEKLIRRMAGEGSGILLITHREELLETADVASLICAGQILFSGAALEVRQYYSTRCLRHLDALGAQPWDVTNPEAQAALTSNGSLRSTTSGQIPEGERRSLE